MALGRTGWFLTPLALAFIACGSAPAQQGYFAQGSGWAAFLQLTRNDSSLNGDLEAAAFATSDPTTVTTLNASFTGRTDGNSITLTFPEGFGVATSISGSYSGSNIELSIPQSDGTLQTEEFSPGDTNAYNAAVNALHQQASQALAEQQAAQQQAAQASAAAQQQAAQQAAVDKANVAVGADFEQITHDLNSFPGLYSTVNQHLQQTYTDTVTTYNALQKVAAEGPSDINCGTDSVTVGSDAITVQSDQVSVQADQTSEQVDVMAVNSDIAQLQSDYAAFQSAEAALPTYQPAHYTPDQVSQAASQAASANSQADAMINSALGKVQGWVNQANGYASSASKIC